MHRIVDPIAIRFKYRGIHARVRILCISVGPILVILCMCLFVHEFPKKHKPNMVDTI